MIVELIVCSALVTADFNHKDIHCGVVETKHRISVTCDWMDAQAKAKGRVVTRCSIKRDIDEVKA